MPLCGARRARAVTVAAALLLACAACGRQGRIVAMSRQAVQIPDPAPGTVNVALLRFDLDAGAAAPVLRQTNTYHRPPTAVYLAATAQDLTLSNGYVGLVAIADLQGAGQAAQRRSPATVTASQGFSIVFVGNAAFGGAQAAGDQGLASHGSWSIAWDLAAANASGIGQDGAALLDEIAAQLLGSAPSQLVAALGGQPVGPPTGSPTGSPTGPPLLAAPAASPTATAIPSGPAPSGPAQVAAGNAAAKPAASPTGKPAVPAKTSGSGGSSGSAGSGAPGAAGGVPTAPIIPLTPPGRLSGSPNPTTPSPGASSPGGTGQSPPPTQQQNGITATVVSVGQPPTAAGTAVVNSLTTSCVGGSVLTDGGSISDGAGGEADSGSIALTDSVPFAISGGSASFWQVGTLPGAQPVPDEVTDLSVVCLLNGPAANVVTSTVVPGPSTAAGLGQVTATAICPAGTMVVGGGGSIIPQGGRAPVGVTMTASYPSTATAGPVTSGAAQGWSVVGTSGGGASTTSAYAICLPSGSIPAVHVTASAPAAPPSAGAPAVAVATCAAGGVLLGGGFAVSGSPLPDAHVRASYPSAADGSPVIDAPVSDSWTAIAEAEHATATSTTTAFALCSG